MKLANGTTVIAKPYQDEDAKEIVNLINVSSTKNLYFIFLVHYDIIAFFRKAH